MTVNELSQQKTSSASRVVAIVLAAGESRRMGTQKLLLPFAGATVVEHVVSQLSTAGLPDIVVVTGKDRERIEAIFEQTPVRMVYNADYQNGMLTSVRAGIKALSDECDGILIALGDQPLVQAEVVSALVRAFKGGDKPVVVPIFNGKRGHPLLFSSKYREEILADFDDVGLRGLLHRHADAVQEVHVSTETVLTDMDYPEDYERALRMLEETK